jgi:RNA polymerase sigma-70 factor (ECF subfamily)
MSKAEQIKMLLEEAFTHYQQPLYRYFYQFLRDREQAEDLVQTTFLRMQVALGRMEHLPISIDSPWMYRIGYNLAVDVYRKKKLRQILSLDTSPSEQDMIPWIELMVDECKGNDPAFMAEVRERLKETLALLSQEDQMLFLRTFAGFPLAETPATAGKTQKANMMRLYRKRRSLRQKVGLLG